MILKQQQSGHKGSIIDNQSNQNKRKYSQRCGKEEKYVMIQELKEKTYKAYTDNSISNIARIDTVKDT